MEKCILTGISSRKLDFKSDFFKTTPHEYGVLDRKYAEFFGFTNNELEELLNRFVEN